MDKQSRILHGTSLHHLPIVTLKFRLVMKVVVSVVNIIPLIDLIIASFNLLCRKLGRLVPYRSPMADLWDSVETFLSFEDRNRNVHE
jgi:hypothetical protein